MECGGLGTITDDEAEIWYRNNVAKSFLGRNPSYFHVCCHSFSQRKKAKGKNGGHPKNEPFSTFFYQTGDRNLMAAQVQTFFNNYCSLSGLLPWKNIAHSREPFTSEEEEPAKNERGRSRKRGKSGPVPVSRLDKDKRIASHQRSNFDNGLKERVASIERQIVKIRPESNRAKHLSEQMAASNKILIVENERLSNELLDVKKELAEQKKAFKDFKTRFDAICKEGLGGLLGKRDQNNSSSENGKSSGGRQESSHESKSKASQPSSPIREKDVDATFPAN